MRPDNYNTLHEKLDAFIRKYYKNQLIKGLIYGIGLVLAFFLIANLLEYFGQFQPAGRAVLFWVFVASSLGLLVKNIAAPLIKLTSIGKIISHEQAAEIVGNHFSDVRDKLLNTLQLNHMTSNADDEQLLLVKASINQRIEELNPIPFSSAIDLTENRKHLLWLLIPAVIFGGMLLINSDFITGPSDRLLHYGVHYEKKAPFAFVIDNDSLEVVEKEDFTLKIKIEGNYAPEKVFIDIDGRIVKMEKESSIAFKHTFKNVQNNTPFRLTANDYDSKQYELKTIPNPTILNFEVDLSYPSYTRRADQTIKNTGDLIIPEGTDVTWKFKTANTDRVEFEMNDSILSLTETLAGQFELEKRVIKSADYTVKSKNEFMTSKLEVSYFLNMIQDQHPEIQVEESVDSTNQRRKYFAGNIKDDYGFKKLEFSYRIISKEKSLKQSALKTQSLSINPNYNQDQFFHYWDLTDLALQPGDLIEYFFTVWDNDAVNGSKSARTQKKYFKAPTKKELTENANQANDKIKKELEESIKEAQDIKKELKEAQKDMFSKKNMTWQDKNRIQDLLDRQKQLENKLDMVQQQNKNNNQQQKQYKNLDKELLEKQKMLEELFDKIMDDEMKKLYEELEKLMNELDKDKVQEKLEEMNWNQEDMEKSMEQSLELFKQFEFEQKVEDIASKLEDIAKKQEELAQESEEKKSSSEERSKKQDELNKEQEEIKEEVKKLSEMNEELKSKHDVSEAQQDMEKIEQEMNKSSEQLSQKKDKKAAQSQKSASEQMKESAQKLKNMLSGDSQKQAEEDMQALRMLLENLITFSFDQENVMEELKALSTKDPKYVDLGREQRKLKDDARIIEDSLMALAQRQITVANIIGDEVKEMKRGIASSIENIKERKTPQARERQQFTMTSANNLALLLDEAMQQMQQQMASKMPGMGECQKPGGMGKKPSSGKPSQSLSEMRKQMQQQLEKMKDALSKGKNPGEKNEGNGKKPGKKGGQNSSGGAPTSSEELAKLAAQQAMIRKEMQRLSQELNKDGSGDGNGLKKIAKDMEKLEEELVNKRFNNETLLRQQEIVSRLLEHEKAERQQEFDNKRKSEGVKNQNYSNPNQYFEYKRKKEKEVEMLKTVPPDLKQYYKNKVNEYYNKVD